MGGLAFLSGGERELLLRSFNDTDLAPSDLCHPEQTIHGLLEHWAAAAPDAPAVVYEVLAVAMCCLCQGLLYKHHSLPWAQRCRALWQDLLSRCKRSRAG